MTTAIDTKPFTALHARIEAEVQQLKNNIDLANDTDLLLANYNKLQRYAHDIDYMRLQIHDNNQYLELNKKLHYIDRDIKNTILDIEIQIDIWHNKIIKEQEKKYTGKNTDNTIDENIEIISSSNNNNKHESFQNEESIESLKSRLLSTKYNQLDQVESTEIQNNYHESIQQELIDSLPNMVTSIKDQALQFQEMLKQDAFILKEATQNFEASHGKFDNVNTLLSKYHKEGRLGIWFYIRIIGMVLISFLFLLIIIRLIPARH
ncbi:hypothetical protein C6P42_001990 [Pichia californica]|nr:hypothetical protein C6P42_001990 [[Candida] californica]